MACVPGAFDPLRYSIRSWQSTTTTSLVKYAGSYAPTVTTESLADTVTPNSFGASRTTSKGVQGGTSRLNRRRKGSRVQANPAPKLLVLDIETSPATAYVWKLFDVNIGLEQLIEPSAPICVAAKYVGEDEIFFLSDWGNGHEDMIKGIHQLISEADATITYNGDSFDLKKLRGEFLLAGLSPPPPVTSIDVYKTVKKFGFQSGKLAFIGPFLQVGEKVKNEGFSLWKQVMHGDTAAQDRMKHYCIGDVTLLEEVYLKILPYISNHPYLGETGSGACGACGDHNFQKRGSRRTKTMTIARLQCQTCGSWQDGIRKKV